MKRFLVAVCFISALASAQSIAALENPSSNYTRVANLLSKLYPEICELSESAKSVSISFADTNCQNKHLSIEVEIQDKLEPNAFALAVDEKSGKVIITKGLLSMLKTESELAFVLAHEITHIKLDHFPAILPDTFLSKKQIAHITHIHQSWEYLADKVATEKLYTAGLDPTSALHLLGKLEQFETAAPHYLAENHPPMEKRLERIEFLIAKQLVSKKAG